MLEVGFFIWKMSSMPSNPLDLVALCKQYGIKRLPIKVLDGSAKWNVPNGDKPLMDYMQVLTDNGLIVDGWGYHYPDNPGLQGDAIEERREKLKFTTYHLNAEREWKQPYGMPKAAKLMLDKVKVNGFEVLFCSYRDPSLHVPFPFDAFMNHDNTDGADPQVYWALKHNPIEQLEDCLEKYSVWGKPVYPLGSAFGASFRVGDKWYYWEPTVEDLNNFRTGCIINGINRFYYWSLDWILSHKRYDLLEAATGINDPIDPPPNPPPDEPDSYVVSNCTWLNGRTDPDPTKDNVIVKVKAGQKVRNLKKHSGQWDYVGLDLIKAWMHGDYLD